jgi:outer membrane protein TolC
LQRLVKELLQNNLDLRMAAQRVLEAQAQLGITRSQQLPSVNAGGNYSALQIPSSLVGNKSNSTPGASFFNGGGFSASAAWNLDFWACIVAKPRLQEQNFCPVSGRREQRASLLFRKSLKRTSCFAVSTPS